MNMASGTGAPGMVAVLFARADSVYKGLPGCDVWDAERDARLWQGGGARRGAPALPGVGAPADVCQAAPG